MEEPAYIGSVAKAAGISVQAVRYYERLGLLLAAHRSPTGYRTFGPESLERLRFIRQAQALGFSLDEIKEILRLRFEAGRRARACEICSRKRCTRLRMR